MIDSGPPVVLNEATALDQKQIILLNQQGCELLMQAMRDRKDAKRAQRHAASRAVKRANDADRAKRKRLEKKSARETESARLALLRDSRLDILQEAVRRARGDKRLEQLQGREGDLAMFWQSLGQARHQHGAAASDAQVAAIYCGLSGDAGFNRHKARSRRSIVQYLERSGGPWDAAVLPTMLWPKA
jgi:hypothetical protein